VQTRGGSSDEVQLDAVRADFDRLAPVWDTLYEGTTYLEHVLRDRLHRSISLLGPPPHDGARVFDAGCGAGQLVSALAEGGWTASGGDLAFLQVQAARHRLVGAGHPPSVIQGDGDRLPFADDTFDAVMALGYVEYTPDIPRSLAELTRVLAPGGRLVVTAPNPLRLNYLTDPLGVVRGYLFPKHRGYRRRFLTSSGLDRLLRDAGLRRLRIDGHGLGGFRVAGFDPLGEERAISLDRWLEARVPARAATLLGADLLALAVKRPEDPKPG